MTHDEIRELLVDYITSALDPKIRAEVEGHLKTCAECADEVAVLRTLAGADVPEPEPFFFEALPAKIRLGVRESKTRKLLWRLIPTFAVFALVVSVFITLKPVQKTNNGEAVYDGDPLTYTYMDYGVLSEDDVPSVFDNITGELADEEAYPQVRYTYHRDLAYLDHDGVEGLMEALDALGAPDKLSVPGKNGGA